MTRLHEVIETRLDQPTAFAFIADFANASRWDPGVATSEPIEAGQRQVGVGSRYRLGIRLRGKVSPMEYRITEHVPSSRVVLVGEGSGVSAVDVIEFQAIPSGTRIEYTADIRLAGLLRLVQPLLGGSFAKVAHDALSGMKRTLDAMADAPKAG